MKNSVIELKPASLWFYFNDILNIPRPSKKEGKIIAYLLEFGRMHQLETLQDDIGNVLIRKPATKGMEDRQWAVLQCHIDMVCEKNSNKIHDFDKDGIEAYIEGNWVKANGTTLGADDGIGIAAQLAVLASRDIEHGPLECIFTIDEETGLTGAFGLQPGFLKGSILLNLDSEDEGELFIGCAGGRDTIIKLPIEKIIPDKDKKAIKIIIGGLHGGHSGDDINKGFANANKLLTRVLYAIKISMTAVISWSSILYKETYSEK